MINSQKRNGRKNFLYAARMKRKRRRTVAVTAAAVLFVLAVTGGILLFEKKSGGAASGGKGYEAGRVRMNQLYKEYVKESGYPGIEDTGDFAGWLLKEYQEAFSGEEFSEKGAEKMEKGTIKARDLYDWTGCSLKVLSDQYMGFLENEKTAASHQIYLRGELSGNGRKKTATLSLAGDLCLAEDGFVLDYYDTVNGLTDCISQEILDTVNQADIFFLNHEYCIGDKGEPLEGKYYTFRASPSRMGILEEMGTDLVSLANNHVYDYGPEALLMTADLLEEAGIPYVGGGRNMEEARRPVFFISGGIKIGFVAAQRAEKIRYTPDATETEPGTFLAYDTEAFTQAIADASGKCDFLIAYIHWGTEDSDQFEADQHDMAEQFLKAGADAVVGGHPHVLQGMEYIDDKPVVYSLGDFWFNDETKYTGVLNMKVSIDGLEEMSFLPCLQTGYQTRYISEPAKQRELYDTLENLSPSLKISDEGVISPGVD